MTWEEASTSATLPRPIVFLRATTLLLCELFWLHSASELILIKVLKRAGIWVYRGRIAQAMQELEVLEGRPAQAMSG